MVTKAGGCRQALVGGYIDAATFALALSARAEFCWDYVQGPSPTPIECVQVGNTSQACSADLGLSCQSVDCDRKLSARIDDRDTDGERRCPLRDGQHAGIGARQDAARPEPSARRDDPDLHRGEHWPGDSRRRLRRSGHRRKRRVGDFQGGYAYRYLACNRSVRQRGTRDPKGESSG